MLNPGGVIHLAATHDGRWQGHPTNDFASNVPGIATGRTPAVSIRLIVSLAVDDNDLLALLGQAQYVD
ncbi:hypothetical protein D3C84_1187630 [compost metagenome]